MATSSLQLIISLSGLPAGFLGSLDETFQNVSAVPAWEFKSLTTTESSYVITSTNTRILIVGQTGNATVYYTSFVTGFTATDGQPHHVTEPSLLTIPSGGDTIYFRMDSGTATVFVAQF